MPQYIILPEHGFFDDSMRTLSERAKAQGEIGRFSISMATRGRDETGQARTDLQIIDSVAEDGPKLVAMDPYHARQIRREHSGFQLAPVRTYRPAISPMRKVRTKGIFDGAEVRTSVRILIKEKRGNPVEGATVVAVINRATRQGLPRRRTGQSGQITLTFPGTSTRLDELFIYPRCGTWGYYRRSISLRDGEEITLDSIDLAREDLLQSLYKSDSNEVGKDVRVGVIDTGIDAEHPDLTVYGGENFAGDGDSNDHGAGPDGHGTHVAGILAGHGVAPSGLRGVAPAAQLYSYRVFPKAGGSASTIDIAKAIRAAVRDKCDLINLSLGGGLADPTLNRAIGYAYNKGVICIAATGNDGRRSVSYPAWYKRAVAVSALGSEEFIREHSIESAEIHPPFSSMDRRRFIAGFSNIGDEVDFTAPGVGIVSCFPDKRYAVMSGTSMACPAVTGLAAVLLSSSRDLLKMGRTPERARRIVDLMRSHAHDVGFEPEFQGVGLPLAESPR